MSAITTPALMGATIGAGLATAILSKRPVSLQSDLERLTRGRTREQRVPSLDRLPVWLAGRRSTARRRDLAVTDRDPIRFETRRLVMTLAGLALPVAAALLSGVLGGRLPVSTVLGAALVVGSMAGLLPERELTSSARRARRDAVNSLSAYLDLVTILLAGGAGLETAAQAAAEAGDSPTFQRIRADVARAGALRRSIWSCLADTGRRIGVEELVELGAALETSARHGSRLAESLAVRADAARLRLHHEIEAEANSASERMGLPTVLLFVGFLFLLGYPAVQIILGSS